MTLEIKKDKPDRDLLDFVEGSAGVSISINNNTVAMFEHDGTFIFWGEKPNPKYKDRWKK